eukprot:240173_1
MGEQVTDEEIDEMISMCDRDGDGQIDLEEFSRMVFRHAGPPIHTEADDQKAIEPAPEQKQKVLSQKDRANRAFVLSNITKELHIEASDMEELQRRFYEADEDGSGEIEYPEFLTVMELDDGPLAKTMFKMFDEDGSGAVSGHEFLVSMANLVMDNKDDKIAYAFKVFDIDGSGSISRNELLKILKSTHMAVSDAQMERKADAIMRQGDKDGDGEIDFEEFKKVSQRFPNILFPQMQVGQTTQQAITGL